MPFEKADPCSLSQYASMRTKFGWSNFAPRSPSRLNLAATSSKTDWSTHFGSGARNFTASSSLSPMFVHFLTSPAAPSPSFSPSLYVNHVRPPIPRVLIRGDCDYGHCRTACTRQSAGVCYLAIPREDHYFEEEEEWWQKRAGRLAGRRAHGSATGRQFLTPKFRSKRGAILRLFVRCELHAAPVRAHPYNARSCPMLHRRCCLSVRRGGRRF